jgi:hypothetical protein
MEIAFLLVVFLIVASIAYMAVIKSRPLNMTVEVANKEDGVEVRVNEKVIKANVIKKE